MGSRISDDILTGSVVPGAVSQKIEIGCREYINRKLVTVLVSSIIIVEPKKQPIEVFSNNDTTIKYHRHFLY